MRKAKIGLIGAVAAAALAAAPAGAGELSDYTVKKLLEPCVEGDNDSRWGAAAESECEQYILGFTDALILVAPKGTVCLPELNRADESAGPSCAGRTSTSRSAACRMPRA